ncbi:hypothetical protein NLI96_g2638 [Meripilus lineatus]|uniref:Vacuole protein n=1 Tax=Meripilus lineatus TaxID=2056292 RepID=A0AAD5YGE7_9APHY|nr:hypothetical protein NLI96_g2638 [Physisporinus lineatus]
MCSRATWNREVVPDHKFDFVDTREFTDNSAGMRFKYGWLYIIILKDFLVYIFNFYTAVTMLSTDSWSNAIVKSCPDFHTNGCVYLPFRIGKWLFFGFTIFSLLLLTYEARRAKKIIASRDISYALTNTIANRYYSLRSYDHFCFFKNISASKKRMDNFAFFVFFTFQGWKRLLLADAPRQSVNALTLCAFYLSKEGKGKWYHISKYFAGNNPTTSALIISTAFTFLVFAGSVLLLITASICYLPLLCHLQGNLKRISEIIKRRNKQRLAKAAALAKKEAAGDFSHYMNKKGELIAQPLPQPTLPNISLDDDDDHSSQRAADVSQNSRYYYDQTDYPPSEYPPMPAFSHPHTSYDSYGQYNPSAHTLAEDDDHGITTHLATWGAPHAGFQDRNTNAAYEWDAYGGYQTASTSSRYPTPQRYEVVYDGSPAYTGQQHGHGTHAGNGSGNYYWSGQGRANGGGYTNEYRSGRRGANDGYGYVC